MKNIPENDNERKGSIIEDPEKLKESVKEFRINLEKILEACRKNPEKKLITEEDEKKALEAMDDLERLSHVK